MGNLIRKFVLGTTSVLVLGIGGAALDCAADAGNTGNTDSMPALSQTSDNLMPGTFITKDDIRWAQVELRDAGLYKGSLDGVLGPRTKQALGAFQHKNGLARTASLDAQTWDALTGNSNIGQGSSMPSDTDRAGSPENSFGKSDSGR